MLASLSRLASLQRSIQLLVPTQLIALCALSLTLAACTQSSTTQLPELKRTEADGMLTPAQQQQAIADLARKKSAEEAAAVKQIEKSR